MMYTLARWMLRLCRTTQGIATSLVEAGATVAVGLTLAAAIIPIVLEKGEDGSIARAQSDAQALATSIQAFFGDVQEYPSRVRSGANQRDANLKTVAAFRTGEDRTGTAGGDAQDPSEFLTAIGSGLIENLNDHLVADHSLVANYRTNGLNWKGPYSKTVHQDPWGRNYVVLARAASFRLPGGAETAATIPADPTTTTLAVTATPFYYWVLSAGPDGRLDTTQTSSELVGDDVGVIVTATKAAATSK